MSITRNSMIRVSAKRLVLSFLLLLSSGSANAETLLIWLAEERGGIREVAATSHPVVGEIRSQLPSPLTLLTPLMDLTDQQFIDVDVLWQGNQEVILAASSRYSTEHIMVGRIVEGDQPITEWLLWLSGERKNLSTQGEWSRQAADLTNYITNQREPVLVENNVDGHSTERAEATPMEIEPLPHLSGFHVVIYNLALAADFLDATATLRELFGASAVRIIRLNDGVLRVNVDDEEGIAAIQQALAAHPRFIEVSESGLEFTWK